MDKGQNLFRIRDKRKKGWFYMDNDYLNDGYAKHFGAVGTSIYVSLCRHADNETQKCFPSIALISEELSISRPTVIKYLRLFVKYHLIAVSKNRRNKNQQWQNNEYILLDKSEWVKINSQVKLFNTDSQVKSFSYPSKTDSETQVKSFNTKETHINNTHINKTYMSESFDKFWEKYPKKELKKKSEEIWESKKLDSELDEILNFIEKAKKTERWQLGYIKQPPTFLRNECWKDDLSAYGQVVKQKVENKYKNIKQTKI